MDLLLLLRPWHGAVAAFLVALAVALAGRGLRRPLVAALAGGIGTLAGWWITLGLLTASPRQLPERLPLLALVLVLATPALILLARRWRVLAWPALALGALWTGWWMAGAPMTAADLRRAGPVLAAVAAAALLLAARGGPRWAGPVAAAALLAAMAAAPLPGPQIVMTAALLAAAVAAWLVAPRGGGAPQGLDSLPLAGALAGLAAMPVLARGAPADWAVAAAPLLALAVGAPLGARLSGRFGAPVGAILAGSFATVAAYLSR